MNRDNSIPYRGVLSHNDHVEEMPCDYPKRKSISVKARFFLSEKEAKHQFQAERALSKQEEKKKEKKTNDLFGFFT